MKLREACRHRGIYSRKPSCTLAQTGKMPERGIVIVILLLRMMSIEFSFVFLHYMGNFYSADIGAYFLKKPYCLVF